ncbi:MAG: nitrogen fixation protein NifZ [Gammaproteobacteria bacterium]|nr:nitrogen fixation protein NifZ [Gammaproteobacteria bacterium]
MSTVDLREPRYQEGLAVAAALDLYNDGSHPELAPDALLVAAGTVGEIVQVGHHVAENLPIYMVDFAGRRVVGCLEEEISPWRQPPPP